MGEKMGESGGGNGSPNSLPNSPPILEMGKMDKTPIPIKDTNHAPLFVAQTCHSFNASLTKSSKKAPQNAGDTIWLDQQKQPEFSSLRWVGRFCLLFFLQVGLPDWVRFGRNG